MNFVLKVHRKNHLSYNEKKINVNFLAIIISNFILHLHFELKLMLHTNRVADTTVGKQCGQPVKIKREFPSVSMF
jgi:hypothetical protein